ncbi:MAG: sensor histidine kinase [Chloroflexota bacterium]
MQKAKQISPYRIVAISLYVGVIISKFVKSFTNTCELTVIVSNDPLFLGTLSGLIGLEIWEHRKFANNPPFRAAIILLVVRMVAFEIVRLGDCTYFYGFLYLIPPLLAFRYFSPTAGYALGVVYFFNYGFRMTQAWGFVETVDELLIYTVGIIFGFMMANIAAREEQNRLRAEQLFVDLKQSQGQVAELAATEERNRLARNIHDTLGHYLTVVGIQLDKAIAYKEIDGEQADQAILHAKRAADNALEDVRQSVSSLREDDHFTLKDALNNLVESSGELPIELAIIGEESRYSRLVLTTIFRIAQEGLTNIHKHAKASEVKIDVGLGLNQAELVVEDNGRGFDTDNIQVNADNPAAHFGLQGLRERLELVGGKLQIESQKNQGTVLNVIIPRKELGIK